MSIEYHIGTPSYYYREPSYVFKPIYITADDVKKSMDILKRIVKFGTSKAKMRDVTFYTIGGRSKTFRVDDIDDMTGLNKGDIVEITHREDNWNGTYEVTMRKDWDNDSIQYHVVLKELELRHTHGGHNKRWIATTNDSGQKVTFKWGKIGGTLQSMEKTFPSQRAAGEFIHEKIEEKLKKGYNQK